MRFNAFRADEEVNEDRERQRDANNRAILLHVDLLRPFTMSSLQPTFLTQHQDIARDSRLVRRFRASTLMSPVDHGRSLVAMVKDRVMARTLASIRNERGKRISIDSQKNHRNAEAEARAGGSVVLKRTKPIANAWQRRVWTSHLGSTRPSAAQHRHLSRFCLAAMFEALEMATGGNSINILACSRVRAVCNLLPRSFPESCLCSLLLLP